ncbi:Fungal specific transcription factor domain containing protein [Hyaloscypha variabilis]
MADAIDSIEDHGSEPPGENSAKRRKRDIDRTRVSRACDRCKRKKTRCSGTQPCPLCIRAGSDCQFTAPYTRGRVPSVPLEEHIDGTLRSVPREFEHSASEARLVPGLADRVIGTFGESFTAEQSLLPSHQIDMGQSQLPHLDQVTSRAHSSRNSPEPSQTDLQGHYVGPSSGVSFLLRVQKKLHQKVSFSPNSSIFTFGDAPLPEFDPSFFVLPPKDDAQKLVARYFEYAIATHRFLHRPTVEQWLEEFYDGLGVMKEKHGARERTAVLFMVFAQATEYMIDSIKPSGVDTSARYFQIADNQLSSETGEIRLTSVQARLCQCFYLLARSRVNHCWSLFGTTAHLILAIGIHRKRRVEASNGADLVEVECRKRVFWCAYGLDNYLSAALGRPRTFHDDDIDQELPTCVNDSDLTPQRINTNASKAQSIMMASVAHNTLAKILSHILHDLYSIRPPPLPVRVSLSQKYSEELQSWRKNLSRFLDAEGVDTSLLIPLFQRQRNVLNLAYYHALILVHRPFLLSNFASLNSRKGGRGAPGTPDMDRNVKECLNAAMKITEIVNELTEGRQIFRAFWFTQYFAFCAVVVLYVYTIQQRTAPEERYRPYFDAATRCQKQISAMAENESLAQRYTVVLEELRLEAIKQTQNPAHQLGNELNSAVQSNFSAPQAVMQPSQIAPGGINGTTMQSPVNMFSASDATMQLGDGPNSTTPSSLMAELTSWGEFDSLVTAGIGGLDYMFLGDSSRSWDVDMDADPGRMLLQ